MEHSPSLWLDALRRWWLVPLTAALFGSVAGLLASAGALPTATATLALQIDSADSSVVARQTQAALAQAQRSEVYERAATKSGMTEADVRHMTTLAAGDDGLSLQVRARDADEQRAAAVANNLATAVVEASQAEVQAQLKELETATTKLILTPAITDAAAERARITRLGEGLADNQSRVVAKSNNVRILQLTDKDEVIPPTSRTAGISGLFAGLLLGLLGVILWGARRGRVHRLDELQRLYPSAVIITPSEIGDLVAADDRASRRVLVASENPEAAVARVRDALSRRLGQLRDDQIPMSACRPGGLAYLNGMHDPDTIVITPVRLGKTKIPALDRQFRAWTGGVLLVLTDSEAGTPRLAQSPNAAHA